MCQQFPGIFNGTFHSGLQPIISPIDLSTVIAVDQSYGCRGGTRSKLQMPDSGTAAAFGINSNKDGVMQLSPRRHESSLERVASQMLGQMQQMASSQQRMFEIFGNWTAIESAVADHDGWQWLFGGPPAAAAADASRTSGTAASGPRAGPSIDEPSRSIAGRPCLT